MYLCPSIEVGIIIIIAIIIIIIIIIYSANKSAQDFQGLF